MILLLIIFIFTLLTLWYILDNVQSKDTPPGPRRLPILGTIPQVLMADPLPFVAVHKLSKKYGEVMSLRMGSQETVILSSYEATKDLFGRNEFEDRLIMGPWSDRQFGDTKLGILFSEGKAYRENKKSSHQILRLYGFGNKEAQQRLVQTELMELVDNMKASILEVDPQNIVGKRIRFHNFFTKGLLNLISSLVTGERLHLDNPDLQLLADASYKFLQIGHMGAGIISAWPSLRHIFPGMLGYNKQMEAFREKQNYAKKLLDKHRKLGLYKTNPTCFTDTFLQKMEQTAGDPDTPYTEKQFLVMFSDFIIGASYTQDSYMAFSILLLALNPEVQEKLYKEISSIIGKETWPDTSFKSKMPYTQAVMTEVHRWARIGVNIPRTASKDVMYNKYRIKKGAHVVANLHSIFFDEEYWKDPDVFRPQRYFNEDGSLNKEKLQRVIMFGTGKRQCYGEALAQDSTFLYFTTIFQRFSFKIPEGESPSLKPLLGVALRPAPYDALVGLRI